MLYHRCVLAVVMRCVVGFASFYYSLSLLHCPMLRFLTVFVVHNVDFYRLLIGVSCGCVELLGQIRYLNY